MEEKTQEHTSACLPVDFAELVSQSIENMRYFIGADEVNIESDVNDTKTFEGNPTLLGIILNNLISNGIKHRKPGNENSQVTINVIADFKKAIIHVLDNGIGIKSSEVEKVFDLFYRTNKNETGGGMGLYLVKEIISKLGGKIMVESAENTGTEFTVEIPNLNAVPNVIRNDNKKYFE
jgi:two-component system, sensor histidine kinase and response regulator